MLTVSNTKEACSKQKHDKNDDIPQFKIRDLIMIKNFDKKLNWDTKYVPHFRVVRKIGTRQLEVSDLKGRLWKLNISDVHKILPTDIIVSCLPDKQIFARKGKYINDSHILKEVLVIDIFLHEYFPHIRLRHQ